MKINIHTQYNKFNSNYHKLFKEYEKRLSKEISFKLISSRNKTKTSEYSYDIVIDKTGKNMSSEKFSKYLYQLNDNPKIKEINFYLSHSRKYDIDYDEKLSLISTDIEEKMLLVILGEQIYRASTIRSGRTYHK